MKTKQKHAVNATNNIKEMLEIKSSSIISQLEAINSEILIKMQPIVNELLTVFDELKGESEDQLNHIKQLILCQKNSLRQINQTDIQQSRLNEGVNMLDNILTNKTDLIIKIFENIDSDIMKIIHPYIRAIA